MVILGVVTVLVLATGQWQPLGSVPPRTWVFLALSGAATGGSWLCYFRALKIGDAARVAPIDKLSVVLVAVIATLFLGREAVGHELAGRGADRVRRGAGRAEMIPRRPLGRREAAAPQAPRPFASQDAQADPNSCSARAL